MDRLTFRDEDGDVRFIEICDPKGNPLPISQQHPIWADRLAAYEDTGLMPMEIKSLLAEWRVNLKCLDKYRKAESEGRLIVLPCKVGDAVWSGEPFTDKKIREGTIVEINIDAYGFCGFWASFHPGAIAAEFIKEDIGEIVFFTREEAEGVIEGEK